MRRFDAVIFDWGNTIVDYPLRTTPEQIGFLQAFLLDSAPWLQDVAKVDIRSAAGDRDRLAAFNRENDSLEVRKFSERLRALTGGTAPAGVAAMLEDRLCRRIFETASVIEGAPLLLAAARRAGLRICILSNAPWGTSPVYWREEVARHAFARDVCDAVVFCGDVGYRKPHRTVFEHCVGLLGTAPQTTAMVGDSLTSDVIGAEKCGHFAVWLDRDRRPNPHGHASVERLEQVADVLGC
jgi:FMN phosphatase YigB (HAD superfamily)